MRIALRLFWALFAVAVMALGIWLGLVTTHVLDGGTWGLPGVEVLVNPAEQLVPYRLFWLAVSVAVLGVGSLLLVASMSGTQADSTPRIVLKSPDPQIYGDTRVTVTRAGVRSIIAHAVQNIDGVREADATAHLGRKGWTVSCRVAVWNRTVIPEVAPLVMERVRQTLEHHTGIPVARVEIDTQFEPLHPQPNAARVA